MPVSYPESPYFEGRPEESQYVKILFKAGEPLQARELNEQARILQTQIASLGSHVFNKGARVQGTSVKTETLNTMATDIADSTLVYTRSSGDVGYWEIRGSASLCKARIHSTDKLAAIAYQITEGDGFIAGENVQVYNPAGVLDNEGQVVSLSKGTFASIGEGVFFINGYFVSHPGDQRMLSYTTVNPTGTYGLAVSEDIINFNEDPNLEDNAVGYPNEGMPGADRVKIRMTAEFTTSTDVGDSDDFIRLISFENGFVQFRISLFDYNIIGRYIDTRTFEESGNYTVGSPKVSVKRHLKKSHNDADGVLLAADGGIEGKTVAIIDPLVAYHTGRRIHNTSPAAVIMPDRHISDFKTGTISAPEAKYGFGYMPIVLDEWRTNQIQIDNDPTGVEFVQYDSDTIDFNSLTPTGNIIPGTVRVSGIYDIRRDPKKSFSYGPTFKISFPVNVPSTSARLLYGVNSQNQIVAYILTTEYGYSNQMPGSMAIPANVSPVWSRSDPKRFIQFPSDIESLSNISGVAKRLYRVSPTSTTVTIPAPTDGQFTGVVTPVNQVNYFYTLDLGANANIIPMKPASVVKNVSGSITITFPTTATNYDFIFMFKVKLNSLPVRVKTLQNPDWIYSDKIALANIDATNTVQFDFEVWRRQSVSSGVYCFDSSNNIIASLTLPVDPFDQTLDDSYSDSIVPAYRLKFNQASKVNVFPLVSQLVAANPTTAYIRYSINASIFITTTIGVIDTIETYAANDGVEGFTLDRLDNYIGRTSRYFIDFRRPRPSNDTSYYFDQAYSAVAVGSPELSYTYRNYLPSNVAIIINSGKRYAAIEGIPGDNPKPPVVSRDDLLVANIIVPGSGAIRDYRIVEAPSTRYRMIDIQSLDNRLAALERSYTRAMAENAAITGNTFASDGSPAFVNGFVVEDFKSMSVVDPFNTETNMSIDLRDGKFNPVIHRGHLDLYASSDILHWIPSGYNEPVIQVKNASKSVPLNPFFVSTVRSDLIVVPAVSLEVENSVLPKVTIDSASNMSAVAYTYAGVGETVAKAVVAISNMETEVIDGRFVYDSDVDQLVGWDTWLNMASMIKSRGVSPNPAVLRANMMSILQQQHQMGQISKEAMAFVERNGISSLMINPKDTFLRSTAGELYGFRISTAMNFYIPVVSKNVNGTVDGSDASTDDDSGIAGTGIDLTSYIKSQTLTLVASALPSNSIVKVFFDSVDVSTFCESKTAGTIDELRTDANGYISIRLNIPKTTFFGGEKVIVVTTASSYSDIDDTVATCSGKFFSGVKPVSKGVNTSVTASANNNIVISGTGIGSNTTASADSNDILDPIAQSFVMPRSQYVSAFDFYFHTKGDDTGFITVEVRPLKLGLPDPGVLLGKCQFPVSMVNVSNDASVATTITLPVPVRCNKDTSYAVTIGSRDPRNRVWVQETGSNDVATGNIIPFNLTQGALMKSQDGQTWTVINNEDIKLSVLGLKFNSTTHTLQLHTENSQAVSIDSFEFDEASNSVIVNAPGSCVVQGYQVAISFEDTLMIGKGQRPDISSVIVSGSKTGVVSNVMRFDDLEADEFLVAVKGVKGGLFVATDTVTWTTASTVRGNAQLETGSNIPNSVLTVTGAGSFVVQKVNVDKLPAFVTAAQLAKSHIVTAVLGSDRFVINVPGLSGLVTGRQKVTTVSLLREVKLKTHRLIRAASAAIDYVADKCEEVDWKLEYAEYNAGTANPKTVSRIRSNTVIDFDNPCIMTDNDVGTGAEPTRPNAFTVKMTWEAEDLYSAPIVAIDNSSIVYETVSANNPKENSYSFWTNSVFAASDEDVSSNEMKFTSKVLNFDLPFDDVRVMFDSFTPTSSSFKLYFRVASKSDTVAISAMKWINVPFEEKPHAAAYDFLVSQVLKRGLDSISDESLDTMFSELQVKMVFFVDNICEIPVIDNLRLIAIT